MITKTVFATIITVGFSGLLIYAGTKPVSNPNRLEAAVKAGKKIHDVAPHAAKPGERPNDYGSPGRDKHGKPPPPGKEKKP